MEEMITVCDECERASCWRGDFMCEGSRNAGTTSMTKKELLRLNLEHPSHWETKV